MRPSFAGRLAGEILHVARLLADQDQSSAGRSLAEHRLGAALPKVAPAAAFRLLPQRRQRGSPGHALSGAECKKSTIG
jgi:hypothetical protein